jgi:hypothetical protein
MSYKRFQKMKILGIRCHALIEHGPHWINFIIFTFINEDKENSKCIHKFWREFISFDIKKKANLGHVLGFVKEKVSLEILGVIPCVSNGISQSRFDPPTPYFKPF